jgi:lipoprotein NlpI
VEGVEESLAQWTLAQISEGSTAAISMKDCEDAQFMENNSKLAGVLVTVKFYLEKMTLKEESADICMAGNINFIFAVYAGINCFIYILYEVKIF